MARVADPIDRPKSATDTLIPHGRRVSAGRGAAWIGEAWRLFRQRPGKWLLILLLIILIYVVSSVVPFANIVGGFVWPFIAAGIVMAADLQRRTGTFEPQVLLGGLRERPVPLLILGAILMSSLLVFYLSLAIFVGADVANVLLLKQDGNIDPARLMSGNYALALLVYLAVVLPIGAATYLATPLIVLHGVTVGAAMRMSLAGSIGNILPGIVYSLCVILVLFASLITLGLGLLVAVPVLIITNYTMYRDIFIEQG